MNATVKVIALCLATVSCGSWLEPARRPTPDLVSIGYDGRSRLGPGGVLIISGFPSDTSYRLDRDDLILEISTSTGDTVVAQFRRAFCPVRERGFRYFCSDFLVVMESGLNTSTLLRLVSEIGGRFGGSGPGGPVGSITVISPNGIAARVQEAERWPGVAMATFSRILCDAGTRCFSRSQIESIVPVEIGSPVSGDGVLQVMPRDTIRARYERAGSGIRETIFVVPGG